MLAWPQNQQTNQEGDTPVMFAKGQTMTACTSAYTHLVLKWKQFTAQAHPGKQGSPAVHHPAQRFTRVLQPSELEPQGEQYFSYHSRSTGSVWIPSLNNSFMSWVALPPYIGILENLSLTCPKPHVSKRKSWDLKTCLNLEPRPVLYNYPGPSFYYCSICSIYLNPQEELKRSTSG